MRATDRLARRHFNREVAGVEVPEPPRVAARSPARRLPSGVLDALFRGAAVAAIVGSLVVLAVRMPQRTPLRDDLVSIARERAWERFQPEWERLRDLLSSPAGRRILP